MWRGYTVIDFSNHGVASPLKIIIGAGDQCYDGWIATHMADLDLTNSTDWSRSFAQVKADNFLCEHVWEHLTLEEGIRAAKWVFDSLKPGGLLRASVPDANFPNEAYQLAVQVGGPGPLDHPAADHKIVYDYRTFSRIFSDAGFQVVLLEYCDDEGRFHFTDWDLGGGMLYRTRRFDHRNQEGTLGFVSIAIDARKPQ